MKLHVMQMLTKRFVKFLTIGGVGLLALTGCLGRSAVTSEKDIEMIETSQDEDVLSALQSVEDSLNESKGN
jgi:hypothetical protein